MCRTTHRLATARRTEFIPFRTDDGQRKRIICSHSCAVRACVWHSRFWRWQRTLPRGGRHSRTVSPDVVEQRQRLRQRASIYVRQIDGSTCAAVHARASAPGRAATKITTESIVLRSPDRWPPSVPLSTLGHPPRSGQRQRVRQRTSIYARQIDGLHVCRRPRSDIDADPGSDLREAALRTITTKSIDPRSAD